MNGSHTDWYLLIVCLLVIGAGTYIVSMDEVVFTLTHTSTGGYQDTPHTGWFKDLVGWTLIVGGVYFGWKAVSTND
ncbi:MAG: hypothetical protein KC594_06280 [Nitrospira sp.]|nr:hypothetical protein [Nitrospira sp.]